VIRNAAPLRLALACSVRSLRLPHPATVTTQSADEPERAFQYRPNSGGSTFSVDWAVSLLRI
jgi:hypothetical protein